MSLHERIEVEPLDEARLERLEQRIVRAAPAALARPARPMLWPWGLAIASAAAAALAVLALRPAAPGPAPAMAVATSPAGTRVDLGDAVVTLGADTRFAVTRPGGGVRIALAAGMVALEVAPRRDRPPLWVDAGDVAVRVVGTAFSVSRRTGAPPAGREEIAVAVSHGVVEVHRDGAIATVRAGERWSSIDGAVLAVLAVPAVEPDPAGPVAQAAPGDHPGDVRGPDSVGGAGPGEREGEPGVAPRPTGETQKGPGQGQGPRPAGKTPALTPLPADPLGDLRTRIQREALAPALELGGLAPADAAQRYQEMAATGRGGEASAALYSLALTQHARLGKDAEALRSLDAYLRRFARGPELEAVLWLRLRILCRRQFDDTCRQAAHTYVTRYPDGARGTLAQRVTNTR